MKHECLKLDYCASSFTWTPAGEVSQFSNYAVHKTNILDDKLYTKQAAVGIFIAQFSKLCSNFLVRTNTLLHSCLWGYKLQRLTVMNKKTFPLLDLYSKHSLFIQRSKLLNFSRWNFWIFYIFLGFVVCLWKNYESQCELVAEGEGKWDIFGYFLSFCEAQKWTHHYNKNLIWFGNQICANVA